MNYQAKLTVKNKTFSWYGEDEAALNITLDADGTYIFHLERL
ncbi:hypothetical protein ACJQWY_01735 [Weissella kandleri]